MEQIIHLQKEKAVLQQVLHTLPEEMRANVAAVFDALSNTAGDHARLASKQDKQGDPPKLPTAEATSSVRKPWAKQKPITEGCPSAGTPAK